MLFQHFILVNLASATFAFSVDLRDVVFGDWLATIDDDTCWISTHPEFSNTSSQKFLKTELYFTVALLSGSPDPEVSLYSKLFPKYLENIGFEFQAEKFDFVIVDDFAFTSNDNDHFIVRNMAKKLPNQLNLYLNDATHKLEASVSYQGFQAAYNFISKNCRLNKSSKNDRGET
jgi:hypothetical protein